MPGFDQTGPVGQGSKTGLKMGRCTHGVRRKDEPVAGGQGGQGAEETLPEDFRGRGLGRGQGGQGRGRGGLGGGRQNRFRGGS